MVEQISGYPISNVQQRLWRFQGQTPNFYLSISVKIKGALSYDRLKNAFEKVVTENNSLKLTFHQQAGVLYPLQVVQEDGKVHHSYTKATQEGILDKITAIEEYVPEAYDFEAGLGVYLHLVSVSECLHYLIVKLPTLMCDSQSLLKVIKQTFEYYHDWVPNISQVQYIQYATWQNNLMESPDAEAKAYWDRYPVSTNPWTDYLVATTGTNSFLKTRSLLQDIPEALSTKLSDLAGDRQVSKEAILLACYQLMLFKISHQEAISLSYVNNQRKYQEVNNLIGAVSKSLPLTTNIRGTMTFADLATQIHEALHTNSGWEDHFSYDQDNDWLPLGCGFEYLLQEDLLKSEDQTWEIQRIEKQNVECALKLFCFDREEAMLVEMHYAEDDKRNEAALFLHQYVQLLENITKAFDQPIEAISSFSPKDQVVLENVNRTHQKFAKHTVVSMFQEAVSTYPGHTSVVYDGKSLSYQDLDQLSNQIAHLLINDYGIKKGDRVALWMGRSHLSVASMLAIIKTGAVYVALDRHIPQERLKYILQDSGASLVIRDKDLEVAQSLATLVPESEPETIENQVKTHPGVALSPADPVYIIYTSGSTGHPKGVLISHASLLNYVQACQSQFSLSADDSTLLFSSVAFDLSYTSLWTSILMGARLTIAREHDDLDVEDLLCLLATGVTYVKMTPSHFNLIVSHPDFAQAINQWKLRLILLGGEEINCDDIQKYYKLKRNTTFVNHYGPTESTVGVLTKTITYESFEHFRKKPVIGQAILNNRAYILNKAGTIAAIGEIGELAVAGAGLATAYVNLPDLTGERFRKNQAISEDRIYLTGDMGRRMPDGDIEFLGRKDFQVKIRGYRIELPEIEKALALQEKIRDAVVLVAEEQQEKMLVAYLLLEADQEVSTEEVKLFLHEKLPPYMVPHHYFTMMRFPLTANGKVDRSKLPSLDTIKEANRKKYVAPRTAIEQSLKAIWEEVLGRNQLSVDDNFFDLGGNSLKVIKVVSRIFKELNIKTDVKTVFKHPTVARLGEKLLTYKEAATTEIVRLPEQEYYNLSHAQKRLWVICSLEEVSRAYNMSQIFQRKELNFEVLKKVVNALVERHEILRTTLHMVDGVPKQKVHNAPEVTIPIEFDDLSTSEKGGEVLREILESQASTNFDFEEGPLMRIRAVRLDDKTHFILFTVHHIISDGWSLQVLTDEFDILYTSFLSGEQNPLKPLEIQYRDYAAWQNSALEQGVLNNQKQYWLSKFEGEVPVLNLEGDQLRPGIKTYNGSLETFWLDDDLSSSIRKYTSQREVTLFMFCLAVVKILLYKYTGQQDLVVGFPVAGRKHYALEQQVGFYVNTIPLRTQLNPQQTFSDFLEVVRENTLSAYNHQTYPFDKLVEDLDLQKDISRNPLFDVMVIYKEVAQADHQKDTQNTTSEQYSISKFDLTFQFVDAGDDLGVSIEYNTDLFEKRRIQRIFGHMKVLLREIIQNDQYLLNQVSCLPQSERDQITHALTGPKIEYPDTTLFRYFEHKAKEHSNKVALVTKDHEITYGTLLQGAQKLASILRYEYAVNEGTVVGIMLSKAEETIVAVLGILGASATYLPLDPGHPRERIQQILEEANIDLLITEEHLRPLLEGRQEKFVDIRSLLANKRTYDELEAPQNASALAYVMYTSGSTGQPKGVMINHRSAINAVLEHVRSFNISPEDRVLHFFALTFDVSVYEIFSALLAGAAVVLMDQETKEEQKKYLIFLQEKKVTIAGIPPAFMNLFEPADLSFLRVILTGGESVSVPFATRLSEEVEVFNAYGLTEASICSTLYAVKPEDLQHPILPIGTPLANTQIYILDSEKKPVPIGIPGEVYIGGAGLAAGYYQNEVLTSERFVHNPFQKGDKIYKTGDLAKLTSDGNIIFLGRNDSQIKIRGNRIEIGEIEASLARHSRVKDVTVLCRQGTDNVNVLIAFYMSVGGETIDDLRHHCRQNLPNYMVPATFIMLEEIPRTANQKVDTKYLHAMAEAHKTEEKPVKEPTTLWEERLVALWKEALNTDTISIDNHFFEKGGHSLKAVRFNTLLHQQHNIKLPLKEIFAHPVLEDLAQVISEKEKTTDYQRIALVEDQEHYPITHAQRSLWVLDHMVAYKTAFLMREVFSWKGELLLDTLRQAFQRLTNRHQALRTYFAEVDGEPRQVISEAVPDVVAYIDLSRMQDPERKSQQIAQYTEKPIDISSPSLLRLTVIKESADNFRLLFDIHHIISDGWSMDILFRELIAYYYQPAGQQNELPPLPLQFKDYSVWHNNYVELNRNQLSRYWKERYGDQLPALDLPLDFQRPEVKQSDAEKLFFTLSKETSQSLTDLYMQYGASVYMGTLGVINVFLHHLSGAHDIIVGSPVACRNREELQHQIGLFLNTVPVRSTIDPDETFSAYLQRLRTIVLEVFEYEEYPIDLIIEELNVSRDASRSTLFEVGFTWQNIDTGPGANQNTAVIISPAQKMNQKIKADLWFHGWEGDDGSIALSLTYDKALWRKDSVEQMITTIKKLADLLIKQQGVSIADISQQTKKNLPPLRSTNKKKMKTQDKLSQFLKTKKKTINVRDTPIAEEQVIFPEAGYPLMVRPLSSHVSLTHFANINKDQILDKLHQYGALLFRGFAGASVDTFREVSQRLGVTPMTYVDQSSPRSLIADKIYTSTDYPSDQIIHMHNELSYSRDWPMQISFYCKKAPSDQGETPIADSRVMYKLLSDKTIEKFEQKGIKYMRNLVDGMGLSWKEVYQTDDKAEVKAFCSRNGVDFEWKGDNHLQITWVKPAIYKHPCTGEKLWFNHGFFFNAQTMDKEVRAVFKDENELPFNTYYGDGSPIEQAVIEEIGKCFEQAKVQFPWQEGDLLLMDNMLMAHGRNSFEGERKVLVAMNNPYSASK